MEKRNEKIVSMSLISISLCLGANASDYTMTPDGNYVGGSTYNMAPDGIKKSNSD